jgi:HSP20 family molecular chaperone IbpA
VIHSCGHASAGCARCSPCWTREQIGPFREFIAEASLTSVTRSRDDVAQSTATTEAEMYPQRVPINVYQTTGALVVVAPLPAVKASDVTVELHAGDPATLRFWAHVRSSPPREFLVHEWEYGGYERELDLPAGFGSGLEATLNNGQLAVRVLRGDAVELTITPSELGSKPES